MSTFFLLINYVKYENTNWYKASYKLFINEINIVNNYNNWDYLQFLDKNYTGITRKNNEFIFKIYNNNIFTYNNNGFINKEAYFNTKLFNINSNNFYRTIFS